VTITVTPELAAALDQAGLSDLLSLLEELLGQLLPGLGAIDPDPA
jgi:hypothetical protein